MPSEENIWRYEQDYSERTGTMLPYMLHVFQFAPNDVLTEYDFNTLSLTCASAELISIPFRAFPLKETKYT